MTMTGRDMNREPVNATLTRGYGTLAGVGIIGAAVLALPSTLFLDPLPPAEHYLSTVAALVVGLICMALPWERMDSRWLHLVGFLVTVQAAVAVVLFGQVYAAFYFVIAVAAAYMTATWRELYLQLAIIGVALFGPILWGPQGPADTLQLALVVFPLLCLTTAIFAYLRHRMVADQSSYRLFAEETLSLATRIAGRPVTTGRPTSDETGLPVWSERLRVSTRVAAAVAFVLALPLVTAGLAVAGVKLPAFASDTLGSVGVDLPNQGEESLGDDDPAVTFDEREKLSIKRQIREISAEGGTDAEGRSEGGASGGREAGSPPDSDSDSDSDVGSLSGGSASGGGSSNSAPSQEPSQGESGSAGGSAVPEDVLDDTTEALDEILGDQALDEILGAGPRGR